MTRKECESKIAEHMEAIIGIVKEYNPNCESLSSYFHERTDHYCYSFFNNYHRENSTDAKFPINFYIEFEKPVVPKNPEITLHKDSQTGFYSIFVGDNVKYECLAEDEVYDVLKDLM